MVADKIARQLRKYKEKHLAKNAHAHIRQEEVVDSEELVKVNELNSDRLPELPATVVRSKYFTMTPMTTEAALSQLQLIDHDFYMFHNSETNEINVIYSRNHGGYGVIQPRSDSNARQGDYSH
jgi:putative sigma-54 modulation protein